MADLMTAKQDASTKSKEVRTPVFVDLKPDGECEVAPRQTKESIHAFKDGNEVPLPEYKERIPLPKVKEVKPKTKKKMAKPAKKTAAKKVATPAKKDTTGLIGKATTILLSAADWKRVDKAVADGKGSVRELASKGILKAV